MIEFGRLILANVLCLFARFDSLKRFEKHIIKYAQFSLFDENKSKFDKIILALFCEKRGKYSKFVFYSFKYEKILAIIQIPLLICIYIFRLHLNNAFSIGYIVFLLVLSFWPAIASNAFFWIHYFRSKKKESNSNLGKIISIGLNNKKILQRKFDIGDAINEYIIIQNSSKKKYYIIPENIENVKFLISQKFPYAHTREWIDEQGIEMFEVYFKNKKETISVINIPVCTKKQ